MTSHVKYEAFVASVHRESGMALVKVTDQADGLS
jgi:hypothetical protein